MSRIGKKPIEVPKGVTVTVANGAVAVKGAKGELKLPLRPEVDVKLEGTTLKIASKSEDRAARALQGTARAVLANMIVGVSKGYEKKLEINGVGYEVEVQGKMLVLKLGFLHFLPDAQGPKDATGGDGGDGNEDGAGEDVHDALLVMRLGCIRSACLSMLPWPSCAPASM